MLWFLLRCSRRLERLGFDRHTGIYRIVDNAHDAMHNLFIELHYTACGRGVRRRDDE